MKRFNFLYKNSQGHYKHITVYAKSKVDAENVMIKKFGNFEHCNY